MRLAELTRRVSRQRLWLFGHFTNEEIFRLKQDGWQVTWREGRKQYNKNGIPVGRAV